MDQLYSVDDKTIQDLNGLDFNFADDLFSDGIDQPLGDILGMREFSDSYATSPGSQGMATCFDEFELAAPLSPPLSTLIMQSFASNDSNSIKVNPISVGVSATASNTPPNGRSHSHMGSSLRPQLSIGAPKLHGRAGSSFSSSAAAAAGMGSASSGRISSGRSSAGMVGRGCPKRHRKTIQIKRQEQTGRLDTLNSRHNKLKDAIKVATEEVSAARHTLYTVLKNARQGRLDKIDALSPAPSQH